MGRLNKDNNALQGTHHPGITKYFMSAVVTVVRKCVTYFILTLSRLTDCVFYMITTMYVYVVLITSTLTNNLQT